MLSKMKSIFTKPLFVDGWEKYYEKAKNAYECKNYDETRKYIIKGTESADKYQPKSIKYADFLEFISKCFAENGKYDIAIAKLEQSISILKEIKGDSDAHLVDKMNNLLCYTIEIGNYASAESTAHQLMKICETAHGSESLEMAAALNGLGQVYARLEKYEEAEEKYFKSLAIYKAKLGDDHFDTANMQRNLSGLYNRMGKLDLAISLLETSFPAIIKTFGENHIHVGQMNIVLGERKMRHGDHQEAETILRQGIDILKNYQADALPYIMHGLECLNDIYGQQQRDADSLSVLEEMRAFHSSSNQSNNVPFIMCLFDLTEAYIKCEKYEDAKNALGDAEEYINKIYPEWCNFSFYSEGEKILLKALFLSHKYFPDNWEQQVNFMQGISLVQIPQRKIPGS